MDSMTNRSFYMPRGLIARMTSAQTHTRLKPDGYDNLSELVRAVAEKEVVRLEEKYNGGRPFPKVERLPSGPSRAGALRGAELRALNRQAQAQAEGQTGEKGPQKRRKGA
ncbi:hypothetical protein [Streptomyces sp. NPDC087294]|uniref:hypothetical protein n=1 Tax=Streptomyces sp. NPDC087294 TaxID=3365777 RepID=UPI003829D5EB